MTMTLLETEDFDAKFNFEREELYLKTLLPGDQSYVDNCPENFWDFQAAEIGMWMSQIAFYIVHLISAPRNSEELNNYFLFLDSQGLVDQILSESHQYTVLSNTYLE